MSEPHSPDSAAAAYSVGGAAWASGPSRVYARLADELVASSPVSLTGRLMLDVGSGTGVASRSASAAGARVIASDVAHGMLLIDRSRRPPAVLADASGLPFAGSAFDGVIAAYCYNHLDDPVAGLREAARVTAPGGPILASAYAEDDTHPVKAATEQALRDAGWSEPGFQLALKTGAMPRLATVARAEAAAEAAGLRAVRVEALRVSFPELTLDDLVEWRLGMAHVAWFVNALTSDARAALASRVCQSVGDDAPALVRSVIHITAQAPDSDPAHAGRR